MNRPNSHLSDDELIGLLYGLGDAKNHLTGCPECGERWNAMRKTRAETVPDAEISGRMLAVQRQAVLDRLERRVTGWRWVPAAAAAAVLAVALVLYGPSSVRQPAPAAPATVTAEGDAELFTDVYSMERDVEPRAAAPIRSLFQETSFAEERQ